MYKAVITTSNELMHFNKNHNPANGQFTSGDGDGDGQTEYQNRLRKLDKMSDKRLYKTFKKEIHTQRGKVQGSGNNWMVLRPIGAKSKELIDEKNKLEKQYTNSKEYKEWNKKLEKLEKEWEKNFSASNNDKYEKEWNKLIDQQPKRNFETLYFVKIGKTFTDNYINKGGKELSIAYLEDLGLDETKATEYVDRLIKSGFTLGAT